jgi:DNA uptake protein ComE-like DNA-binding protein
VLPLVLAVLVLAVSVAVGMLSSAATRIDAAEATWRRQQLRAIALSGVRVAMAELEAQREELLDGGTPRLSAETVVYSDGTGRGIATLLSLGDDRPARSELSGLDVNRATAEMLARLPGVSGALAGRIVAGRGRGYTSVEEVGGLAAESGLDTGSIYGAVDWSAGYGGGWAESGGPPVLSLLSVYGFDAEVQQGLGRDARGARWQERVRPTAEWMRSNRGEVSARLGEAAASALERLTSVRGAFESRSALVRALQAQGVPVDVWAGILDLVGVGDDRFARGVVDLNQAPAEVLAALPGLDEASAAAIVARRDSVDGAIRGSIAWPVVEGVLDGARLAEAADWLAARSLVWRVRVRGVLEPPTDAGGGGETMGGMVFDAVIDLTGPRARLAYLREVTSLPLALWLAGRVESSGDAPNADDEGLGRTASPDEDALRIERLSIRRGLSLSRMERPEGAVEEEFGAGVRGESSSDSPSARQDRRIGRWTPGPRGGDSGR